jgi:hypothetical protein
LNASYFIVAILPLWWRRTLSPSKLTGDDPPTAAEKLTLNADAKPEALYRSKRIVNVSNWVISTNDNDGPPSRLSRWQPGNRFGALLLLPKQFFCVDPPQPIVADDPGALVVWDLPYFPEKFTSHTGGSPPPLAFKKEEGELCPPA